jgi:hypothetical protein
LSRFSCKIIHQPGKYGPMPNALTRIAGNIPPNWGAKKNEQVELKI